MRNVFLSFLFVVCAWGSLAKADETIQFTSKNTIALRSEVNGDSVAKFVDDFYKNTSNPLYVYIDSPGGSVIDGFKIIEAIKNDKSRKIVCVANTAASMAFSILQACPVRYVTDHSIVMQHVGSYGIQGQSPNNVTMLDFAERMFKRMSQDDAKRLGLTYAAFRAKIRDDWWMFSDEAVGFKAADGTAQVSCSKELTDKRVVQKFYTLFGTFTVTFSGCPIASDPLKIEMKETTAVVDRVNDEQVVKFIDKLYPRKALLDRLYIKD